MFDPRVCISCGTAGSANAAGKLVPIQFLWRKQVGKSAEIHTRLEHVSTHPMCSSCWEELRGSRRWFWPIRYAGGVALAAGICGAVTVPVLLYSMKLNPAERRYIIGVGIVAAVLLAAGIVALNVARRFSVPPPLLEMTRNSWECISVGEISS
jgi:hypothetical protein